VEITQVAAIAIAAGMRVDDLARVPLAFPTYTGILAADLVRYQLAWDNEGSPGAIAGLFPVCLRNSATELGLVPGGAARSGQAP
jgi:hypothetical protein